MNGWTEMEMERKTRVTISVLNICLLVFVFVNGDGDGDKNGDRVFDLPGQPDVNFAHYAGYITVNESHGRALFYWFFEAEDEPSSKPLVLWLNGGPGCSSIGYGASIELGPFHVKTNGTGLYLNEYSWNKVANLLFVESPVGVGFSYTNTSSDFLTIDDKFTAEDSYEFLMRWFERFPEYKSHDFYIAGESYAGHYVPQLAELLYDRSGSLSKHPINLIGFIVGNPETDDSYDYEGIADYAWSHAITSDQTYKLVKRVCNFKGDNWTDDCSSAMSSIFAEYYQIDIYNIYAPTCLDSINSGTGARTRDSSSLQNKVSRRLLPGLYGGYDPCFEMYTSKYFNRPDVQQALHANSTGIPFQWSVCNNSLFDLYLTTVHSVLPIYKKLIKAGLKIWVYSGDIDGRVPVVSTRYCIDSLNLTIKEKWHPWYHEKQVGGWFISYEGLTFLTFRGAGHLVPLNKPNNALYVFKTYLNNGNLRIKR
ncbi:hypothetical protein SUGI_0776740 [Cryptomeria japonica]|uniref:serine carboxypeptidase-like 26 n=1 Tax=Cryptomeria japonica TaxID=3369 RepID=UPI002414AD90|nr:serine carboxypeptidase-like 26 [Cryptomeria japonica]XP_057848991.1 serine carboxypeptidase-like 26 [Cryptomeria japonica]GLJ38151.1 hypothetical protein SUGI_0776740 [Cryptomeria japonica]